MGLRCPTTHYKQALPFGFSPDWVSMAAGAGAAAVSCARGSASPSPHRTGLLTSSAKSCMSQVRGVERSCVVCQGHYRKRRMRKCFCKNSPTGREVDARSQP